MHWSAFQERLTHFSTEDKGRIQKAFEAGKKAHDGQTRKSGEPYFIHPIAVAESLIDVGADTDTVIAALLHDTVEDTPMTLADIERDFGKPVSLLVDAVTKLGRGEVEERASMDEKIETLRKMFTLMEQDIRIMVIKLADRMHNMQTLKFRDVAKQRIVAQETLETYVPIADRLCMRDWRNELEDLCHSVLEPDVEKELHELQREHMEKATEAMSQMETALHEAFPKTRFSVTTERKSRENLFLQRDLKLQSGGESHPAVTVVLICDPIDECYVMLGHIHHLWQREVLTFDDFVNQPAINGYEALHTTIILESGIRVRCKIRTKKMDLYAHLGIATRCFDKNAKGVLDYLPWTQRITALSQDTKNMSQEFWESLQSDILSESIIVYGPGGRSAVIPKGATALDAVLTLFQERAFLQKAIRVDGMPVSPAHRMEHASSIEISLNDRPTITREWLYLVQTGIGIAMVREELAKKSGGDLEEVGRTILQDALTERGGGYLEEFDTTVLDQAIKNFGYDSRKEAYIAIANRHLEPSDMIRMVEQSSRRSKKMIEDQKEDCSFTYTVDRDVGSLRKLLTVYDTYNISLQNIGLRLSRGPELRMHVSARMTPNEQDAYIQELVAAGARGIAVRKSMKRELLLMSIVVVCWALNPVWARGLIEQGITPFSLVALRALLFCGFSTAFYIGWRMLRGSAFSRVPHITWLALLPAASTFTLSLLTYFSISHLTPSIHLTILRFNVILLPAIHFYLMGKGKHKKISTLLLTGIIALPLGIFSFMPGISHLGLLFAFLSLAAYITYSLVTEQTLQKNKIGIRYPSFLFQIGLILGVIGLFFVPWLIQHQERWLPLFPTIALYVLFCVFVPHTCFHAILQRVRFTHVTSFSLVEVPLAIIFEILLLGLFLPQATYWVIGMLLGAFVVLLNRKIIK